jgi:hypothetical protein
MIAYSERSTANVMSRLEWLVVVGKKDQAGDVGLILRTNKPQQTQIFHWHLILSDSHRPSPAPAPLHLDATRFSGTQNYGNMSS